MKDSQRPIPPSVAAFFPNAEIIRPENTAARCFNHINQVCIVVEDVRATISQYAKMYGWGPFYLACGPGQREFKGREVYYELLLAFCMVGEIEIEFAQPLVGDSPYHEHLRTHGEGLFHIRFSSENIERDLEHLAQYNVKPIFGWHHQQWINVNLDTHLQRGGVRTELIPNQQVLLSILQAMGSRGQQLDDVSEKING